MLALLMMVSMTHGLCMATMPALFDEIKTDLGLLHGGAGFIWGAVSLGALFTTLLGGTLGDRFGTKRVIAVGLLLTALTTAMRSLMPNFWGLSVSMLFFGMAFGLIAPNSPKAVGMWFPPRELGRALGLMTVEGAAGWAVALMLSATLSSALGGWENVMWLMAGITIICLVIWLIVARERPANARAPVHDGLTARERIGKVFRIRDLWFIALMQMCVGGAANANIGLLPETLVERGMTASMAGVFLGISTWTVAAASLLLPSVSDKIGLRKVFIWPSILVCAATVTFFGVFIGSSLVIIIVIYSLAVGAAVPLFRALIIENDEIGSNLTGSAFGLIGSLSRGGQMIIPFTMGAVMDATGQYWPGFFMLTALFGLGAFAATRLQENGWKAKKSASL